MRLRRGQHRPRHVAWQALAGMHHQCRAGDVGARQVRWRGRGSAVGCRALEELAHDLWRGGCDRRAELKCLIKCNRHHMKTSGALD